LHLQLAVMQMIASMSKSTGRQNKDLEAEGTEKDYVMGIHYLF